MDQNPPLPRAFLPTLQITGALTTVLVVAAMVVDSARMARLFDNAHWTVAHCGAAILAWLGSREVDPQNANANANANAASRRWFALGLGVYALGQLIWDAQVLIGWTPFPAPSDLLYLCLAPLCAVGIIRSVGDALPIAERRAVWIDTVITAVAVGVLTIALYLPKRGDTGDLALSVMAAYPVLWISTGALGLVAALSMRLRLTWRLLGFELAVIAHGLLWMRWNAQALNGELVDGAPLNAAFSLVAIVLGASAAVWRCESDASQQWDRFCEALLRLLPLAAVLVAALALAYAVGGFDLDAQLRAVIVFGAGITVVLAASRQTLLLRDRDQLKAAQQALKASEHALRELNDNLEGRVAARSQELTEANQVLQQTVEHLNDVRAQLLDREKMAALGGLVAGISHEINTPIGIAVTAASHLDELAAATLKSLRGGSLKRSDLEQFADSVCESMDMILRNLRKADRLIHDFKQVAVDQSSGESRRIRLADYLVEAAHTLSPALRKSGHRIDVNAPADLELVTDPGAIYQVITNLVQNSVLHGFCETRDGHIAISAARDGDMVVIEYSDDGRGISDEVRRRIFEPFFTTRRGSGGSGLGMHIVFNLASQRLGGDIACLPAADGARFRWRLPVRA